MLFGSSFLSFFIILITQTSGGSRRQCFTCRSRGDLGDCRDPFPYNETTGSRQIGIKVVPCPSGWCGKTIEGVRGPPDDFGTATERSCLSQPPPDGEERCAELRINNKVSLLCVCRGDICNSAPSLLFHWLATIFLIPAFLQLFYTQDIFNLR